MSDPNDSVRNMVDYLSFDFEELELERCAVRNYDTHYLYMHLMEYSKVLYTRLGDRVLENIESDLRKHTPLLLATLDDPICVMEDGHIHLGAAALIDRWQRLKNGDTEYVYTVAHMLTPEVIHYSHHKHWVTRAVNKAVFKAQESDDYDHIGSFPQDTFEMGESAVEIIYQAEANNEFEDAYYSKYRKLTPLS